VAQFGLIWIGCLACALYLIKNEDNPAPPPSIGFPGYVYPDSFGDGGTCDMYEGVKCTVDTSLCCFNADKWCPSESDCFTDNGAYPFGDKRVYPDQMTNPSALTPFPNAILWDWCTIFILGVGNLGALDFQARCMSSKNARVATLGCLIAGCMTFLVGIPFSYLGAITRYLYCSHLYWCCVIIVWQLGLHSNFIRDLLFIECTMDQTLLMQNSSLTLARRSWACLHALLGYQMI
jgi:hypothetical protein